MSESEKEGGEKERKGETELHCAGGKTKTRVVWGGGGKMKQDIEGFYNATEHSGLATAD